MLYDESSTEFMLRQARASERDYRQALKQTRLYRSCEWDDAASSSERWAKQCRKWARYWRSWAATGVRPESMP